MLRCSRMFYHLKSASEVVRKVAVIGSGPTGLTLVRNLLNSNIPALQVDLIERLHVPYGLLRYGVSPDHQDIKDAEKRLDQKIDTYHKRSDGMSCDNGHSSTQNLTRGVTHNTICNTAKNAKIAKNNTKKHKI